MQSIRFSLRAVRHIPNGSPSSVGPYTWFDTIVIALAAAGSLYLFLWIGQLFPLGGNLHISGLDTNLNDQVHYISVARNLVYTGSLTNNLIYLPTILHEDLAGYLYMPGHYISLALSILFLGDTNLAYLAPNLLSFVLSAVCVYFASVKLYTRHTGLLAAAFFILFPANLLFAQTAMSESTVVFAATATFCAFLYLPPSLGVALGPLLLSIPFLFRETTAIILLPMVAILVARIDRNKAGHAFALVFVSLAVLFFIYTRDFSTSRVPTLLPNLFGDSQGIYHDAYWKPTRPIDLTEIHIVISEHIRSNVLAFTNSLQSVSRETSGLDLVLRNLSRFECATLIMSLLPLGVSAALFFRKAADAYVVGTTLLLLTLLVFLLTLYTLTGFRGVRILMLSVPFSAIIIARFITHILEELKWIRHSHGAALSMAIILGNLLFSGWLLNTVAPAISVHDKRDTMSIQFIESLQHDPKRVLVGPFNESLPYINAHYPVSWAFLPRNDDNLRLLGSKYELGTLFFPKSDLNRYSKAALDAEKFISRGEIQFRGQPFLVYQAN